MSEYEYFYPAKGSDRGLGGKFAIDSHAPRGLIRGDDGGLYLVCDEFLVRHAIVLRHRIYQPFLRIELSATPLGYGKWLGLGRFIAKKAAPQEASESLIGRLTYNNSVLRISCNRENRSPSYSSVLGYGEMDANWHSTWAISIDNRIVYQSAPGAICWPEESVRIKYRH